MASTDRTFILTNFVLSNFTNLQDLSNEFPGLAFDEIAPDIYTITVPAGDQGEQDLRRLRNTINFVTTPIPYGLNATSALGASNILQFHNYPYGELRGNGIIIGFVDTGIDYTNTLFKNADNTTRIVSIWDQTIPGNPPPGYTYGSVYSREMINEALSSEDPYAIVPSQDEDGHGTFLAGVAAGNDQTGTIGYTGGAPDAQIAMVKLRPASEYIREEFSINTDAPAFQSNDVITGISYLVRLSVNEQKPLVICLGVGNNYGAHNGTEIVENYLSNISIAPNIIVVIAAGNEGSSGHHYRGEVTNGGTQTLEVNVGAREIGFPLYVWVDIPDKMSIAIRSPLGQVIEKIPIISELPQVFRLNLEQTVVTVTYFYPDPLTGGQKMDIRFENPTPGLWAITVYGDVVINGVFHIWLPRTGFVQSDTRFLSPTPETTLQIPGTEQFCITVGGYDNLDDSVYVSSGRGATTDGIMKPDLIAPSINVQGPVPGGGFTTYIGTSTAAAITSSAAALLMEWAVIKGNLPQMNTRIARSLLTRGARRQSGTIYPNVIEGYGRLDLQATIARV